MNGKVLTMSRMEPTAINGDDRSWNG